MRPLLSLACALFAGLAYATPVCAQVDEDVEIALAAVRVKATDGNVVAQFSLGSILYYGRGDTAQAIDWFRRAAMKSYAPAEFQMGQLYDFGFGVKPDDGAALDWYRKAAEHGSAAAHRTIGDFYRKGRAVKADTSEAARWYGRAADADDLRAQYELGQLYFTGTGVKRDYASAYVWFSLAASQTPLSDNRKGLLELRNIAAARMTVSEVTGADRRVAAWKPAVPEEKK